MPRATGKDHAEINLDIWGDEPWLDLTPAAQHLYFVLWTSPQLSYCGAGEWRPAKIAARAQGWTVCGVEAAAAELSNELFLIIDTATEEYLLRSWIKHDGLWRIPNMAVSMANARADLASRTLRGVIVHEVRKLRDREPDAKGWARDAVVKMLEQKALNPAELEPFTPTSTPGPTPGLTPAATPTATPPLRVNPKDWANPSSNPGPTPAPAPTSSSILQRGRVTGERHQSTRPDSNVPYPNRCPEHADDPKPGPCSACGDVRKADEALQRALREAAAKQRRDFWAEVEACDACDDNGMELDETGQTADASVRCVKHDWSLIRG